MIIEARNKIPFIHLGFGKQEATSYKNTELTIWQDELYNGYFHSWTGLDGEIVSDNTNKLVVKFDSNGVKTIGFTIISPDELTIIASNEITINVVDITWGSADILFSREDITFNTL